MRCLRFRLWGLRGLFPISIAVELIDSSCRVSSSLAPLAPHMKGSGFRVQGSGFRV